MTYNNVQTCGSPPTCFGLFQPSPERFLTKKKNTVIVHIAFPLCICNCKQFLLVGILQIKNILVLCSQRGHSIFSNNCAVFR